MKKLTDQLENQKKQMKELEESKELTLLEKQLEANMNLHSEVIEAFKKVF